MKGILRYYPEPECGGALLGSEETGGTTLGGTWDQAELAGAAPPLGTQSIWIGLELSECDRPRSAPRASTGSTSAAASRPPQRLRDRLLRLPLVGHRAVEAAEAGTARPVGNNS